MVLHYPFFYTVIIEVIQHQKHFYALGTEKKKRGEGYVRYKRRAFYIAPQYMRGTYLHFKYDSIDIESVLWWCGGTGVKMLNQCYTEDNNRNIVVRYTRITKKKIRANRVLKERERERNNEGAKNNRKTGNPCLRGRIFEYTTLEAHHSMEEEKIIKLVEIRIKYLLDQGQVLFWGGERLFKCLAILCRIYLLFKVRGKKKKMRSLLSRI